MNTAVKKKWHETGGKSETNEINVKIDFKKGAAMILCWVSNEHGWIFFKFDFVREG